MRTMAVQAAGPPRVARVARWTLIGVVALGAVGAIVGVIIGLFAYPPTALFAGLEIGVPAALVGAVLGLAAAGIASATRRVRNPRPPAA